MAASSPGLGCWWCGWWGRESRLSGPVPTKNSSASSPRQERERAFYGQSNPFEQVNRVRVRDYDQVRLICRVHLCPAMSFYLQPILQNKCSQSTTDLKVTGHSRAHRYASWASNLKLDAILVRPLFSPILALCCATVQLQNHCVAASQLRRPPLVTPVPGRLWLACLYHRNCHNFRIHSLMKYLILWINWVHFGFLDLLGGHPSQGRVVLLSPIQYPDWVF